MFLAERLPLSALLCQVGLQSAGLHLLPALAALPPRVLGPLVLLQLGARHRLVAVRAERDVAGAVKAVHHEARGWDVAPTGQDR